MTIFVPDMLQNIKKQGKTKENIKNRPPSTRKQMLLEIKGI